MDTKRNKLQTVVETPEFTKQAEKCMNTETKEQCINFIACYPGAGDLIQGTGGVRKIRWSNQLDKGKRGGSRVIYYYHNDTIPIFLFSVFSKGEKSNLSQAERNSLRKITREIATCYEEQNHE